MPSDFCLTRSDERYWLRLSYGYSLLVCAGLGYFLLRIPIQVTDCFTNMLAMDRPFGELMRETVWQRAYLRPGLWAELKLVHALSGGEYFYWFRLTQVAQVAAVILLFVRFVRPRTRAGALVLPLALAVLVGSHTFIGTIREAYPINTFLTIVVCCLAAANLATARPRWWIDVLAAFLFVAAALTVENGLLVWVILVGGYAIGLRGLSRAGVGALVALLGMYFVARFAVLDVGVPSLLDRDAGFGFARRNAADLNAMFGSNPFPFYAYNLVSSVLTVLFAEPREGVWGLTEGVLTRDLHPASVVNVTASTLTTVLIGRFAWKRRHAWMARRFERRDQLVLLFVIVLLANAAFGFGYTKDVIVSPAGVFLAVAAFVAFSDYVEDVSARRAGVFLATVVLLTVSATWAVRTVGMHANLAATAGDVREQWAYIDEFIARWGNREGEPNVAALRRHLRDDALFRHPAKPMLRERWTRVFEID